MTLEQALRAGWKLVCLEYDSNCALVERGRPDGLRERALAINIARKQRCEWS